MPVPNSFPDADYRLVGKVIRAHGLKGELKIVCLSVTPDQFRHVTRVALAAADGRMTELLPVTSVRGQGKQVILKLATIDNRNEADLAAGMDVLVPCDQDSADHDPMEPRHLIGLPVRIVPTGQLIGTVLASFDNGAHQILVVHDGEREMLIPFVPQIVIEAGKRGILVDPPAGLLELGETDASPDR